MEENLAAFNQDAASLAGDGEKAPAVLNACTLADGTASLLIDFSSPAAYMEFMAAYPDEESGVQVKALSILSMEEAELGDVSLTAAAGKEKGDIRQEKCAGFHPKGCVKRLNHVKSK